MKKSILLSLVLLFSLCLITGCTKEEEIKAGVGLNELAGIYQDEFSGRASLELSYDNDLDKLNGVISWGNSASDSYDWTFSLSQSDNKLVYSDMSELHLIYDEEGNETIEVINENLEGYFELREGKILWTGSGDDYRSECIFSKIPDIQE